MSSSRFAGAPAWPWLAFVTLCIALLLTGVAMNENSRPDMTFVGQHRADIDIAHRKVTWLMGDVGALRKQLVELEAKVAELSERKPVETKIIEKPAEVYTFPIIVPWVTVVREQKIVHVSAPLAPAPPVVPKEPPVRWIERPAKIYFIPECWPVRRRR